jgi:hypothetical protein
MKIHRGVWKLVSTVKETAVCGVPPVPLAWPITVLRIFLLGCGGFPSPGSPIGLPGSDRACLVHTSCPTAVLLGPVGSLLFPELRQAQEEPGLAIGDLAISNFIDAMLHPCYRRPKSSRGTEVSGTLLSEVAADAGHEKDLLLQYFPVQYHIAKWWLWPGFSFNAAYFPAMQCHSHIYLFSILSLVYASHSTYAPKINLVGFRELE